MLLVAGATPYRLLSSPVDKLSMAQRLKGLPSFLYGSCCGFVLIACQLRHQAPNFPDKLLHRGHLGLKLL